ncbi:hypothetical protein [uncultured Alistipes sp.]|uniref:hypothetical protein n=1 Tax=uncultured Alistipes sp. TaxID=538949 RepID=UPI002730D8AC|nr:hypothetical protein [uncultured Alistipes sp.]
MTVMTTTYMLWTLIVAAVGYALWTAYYLLPKSRNDSTGKPPAPDEKVRRREIIGKSRFVLDRRRSQPQAAVAAGTEKGAEKEPIFAPASVPEHPRQIPPEDLDEVFGDAPAGEDNEPLDIYYPLYDEPFPDTEAEEPDDEDDTEELPLLGRSLAQGVSFEQMGDAYRHVVHDPPITDEQKEETGRVLLGLKETDLFEAIVSGCPDGNDRVKNLIDTYLSAFHRRMTAAGAESLSPQGAVPDGFDVRDYV